MRKKGRLLGLLLMFMLLLALPLSTQAATKTTYRLTGVTRPSTLKKGSFFNIRGTISCNKTIKQLRVRIYDSTGRKCLQLFTAKPNAKSYNLQKADPYIAFEKLAAGKYYYQINCLTSGGSKTVLRKQFTVRGNGSIRIVNPKPSGNVSINKGASYALGGTISSTYKIASVKAQITNNAGKSVYAKTVKPKKTSYNLANSALDAAMKFDKLAAGTYKLRVTATDSQGTSANVIYRTITVKGSGNSNTNTTPGSSGGSGSTSGSYLNTSEPVVRPAKFSPRSVRPSAKHKFYYNGNYNIYYKYNSLAPTGRPAYGNTYVTGNCTWYACGRAMEIVSKAGGNINKVKAIFGGDPVGIYNANINTGSFKYGKVPKIGALAVFNYDAGNNAHIAVVENIVNGVPIVSESGFTVSTKKPTASTIVFKCQSIYNWAGGRSLRGYIYLV